jgi:hypothetical protein
MYESDEWVEYYNDDLDLTWGEYEEYLESMASREYPSGTTHFRCRLPEYSDGWSELIPIERYVADPDCVYEFSSCIKPERKVDRLPKEGA